MKLANQPHSPPPLLSPLSSIQVTGGFIPSWHFGPTIKLRLSLSSSTCIKRILFHLWRARLPSPGETAGEAIQLSGAKSAKWIQMSSVVQALHCNFRASRLKERWPLTHARVWIKGFLVRGHVSLLGHGVHSSLFETCFKSTWPLLDPHVHNPEGISNVAKSQGLSFLTCWFGGKVNVPGAVCAMSLATKSIYASLYKAPACHDMS